MKIGILGSGQVGQALGRGFLARGDEVMIGSRSPSSEALDAWRSEAGESASTGSFSETAAFAELAVLACLGRATEEVIELAGPENLAGKVVIDATNPLAESEGGPPRFFVGFDDSLGERVQRWLPDSRVVKAFNSVGNPHMIDPDFPGGPPTMFICGDDAGAKEAVAGICGDFGWEVSDVGGIDAARVLEPLCLVWVYDGLAHGSFDHAFKMLRR